MANKKPKISAEFTRDDLKAWLAIYNLTLLELADLLPVSVRTLENWHAGRYKMPSYLRRALRDIENEIWKNKVKQAEKKMDQVSSNRQYSA